MPRIVTAAQIKQYIHCRYELGLSQAQSCRESGVSVSYARTKIEKGYKAQTDLRKEMDRPPVAVPLLSDVARESLTDFELFRRRYLGHVSTPWQIDAAQRVVEMLRSPHDEYLVVNCPPGAGKSTLFSEDLPVWETVRNRALRGILGAQGRTVAEAYTTQVRRHFERRFPIQAKAKFRDMGLACDAEATLVHDFGRFKPDIPEIWKQSQFTVEQFGETLIDEKESTWTAFSQESGQLGWRADWITWDDLVTGRSIATADAIEKQRTWFEDEAETRLEPGGLLCLVGQRLGASDLYRHCLDMTDGGLEEIDFDDDPDAADFVGGPKYHHIVFKAHDESKCQKVHKPTEAKPWPQGCLLDPVRLPFRKLVRIKSNKAEKYEVLYQQQDVDPAAVLWPKVWITGGRDPVSGEVLPGCWDEDRDIAQLPPNLQGPLLSVGTADPSPTKYWSCQWWAVQPATGMCWLLDLVRQTMDAPDFLEYYVNLGQYGGLMDEWQRRSVDMGLPISHWIVEQNAAQRFMLQHDYFHLWMARNKVSVIGHETGRNKADPDYGVQGLLAPLAHHGRMRLPGKGMGRTASLKLVDEGQRWPETGTDDCIMAAWFLQNRLPSLVEVDVTNMPKLVRPDWLRAEV